MNTWRLLLALLLSFPVTVIGNDSSAVVSFPNRVPHIPDMVLSGELGKTWKLSDCEAMSGITCKITLIKKHVHPSRVFFTELGSNGIQLGREIRLIYPNLVPGQKGIATFGIKHREAKRIILRGEWKGPWQDPY